MTRLIWPSSIAFFWGIILPLQAQTNDWASVEKLAPGTSISVVKHGRQSCRVVLITNSELDCNGQVGHWERRFTFAREQVREVRLEDLARNRMIPGAIIGAIVGGLVGFIGGGQASDPETRGYARAYSIPIGASVGGTIGHNFHRHGPVVYRR